MYAGVPNVGPTHFSAKPFLAVFVFVYHTLPFIFSPPLFCIRIPISQFCLLLNLDNFANHCPQYVLCYSFVWTKLIYLGFYRLIQAMSDTRRWSELIPPRTALTFAAMWDPVEGIITFSGGKLLESDLLDQSDPRIQLGDSPRDAYDSQSQVLTIDRLALALAGTAPNSALLALEQSRGPVTFRCEALDGAESAMDPYFQTSWGRPPPINTARTTDSDDSHTLETPKGDHWPQLKHLGRQLLSAAKTPFDARLFQKASCSPTSSSSSDSDSSEEFFEEAPMTANRSSFYSAPMLVNLNLVRPLSSIKGFSQPFSQFAEKLRKPRV